MFDFVLSTFTIAGIFALMALGLNLQAGYAGLLNFGHIAFAGLGAYAAGIGFGLGWQPLPCLALGVGLAVLLGAFMAGLGRKLAADYWGIATLSIAEILRTVATNEGWLTGGANGISAIPALFDGLVRPWNSVAFLALVLAVLASAAWLCARLGNGRFGRALRLMREEPQLATCLGYNLRTLKTRAIMTSAAVTALGGFLYAHYMSFAGPEYMLASETFLLWTMVMIGGLGNTLGVLVGVVTVQAAHVIVPFAKDWIGFGSDVAGALRLGLIGAILLACLLWRSEAWFLKNFGNPMNPLLRVNDVAKAFGGNQVLHGVEFSIAPGEIVGLLGPNGSGKSTLLNTITGFEAIDRGRIEFEGRKIDQVPAHRIVASGVGRTFQLPSMPRRMSVMEVAMAAATSHHGVWGTLLGLPRARQAEAAAHAKATALLEQLLLTRVRDLPASALSGGQKKLLGIVCALMGDPRLLMLDEPTAGVHPNLRRDIVAALQRLNAQGMTLVIVEHDMHFIREVCTRCIVLDRGRIVASCRPDELASNEHVVQAYLGRADSKAVVEAI